jgi:hypothetical protein
VHNPCFHSNFHVTLEITLFNCNISTRDFFCSAWHCIHSEQIEEMFLPFFPEHSASALYSRPLKIRPFLLKKTEIFIPFNRAFYLISAPSGRTL